MNLKSLEETTLSFYNTRVQLWEHLKERTKAALEAGNKRRNAATTSPEAHQEYREHFRTWFLKRIGGLPAPCGPSAPPPEYHITGETEAGHFKIQHLLFTSREGVLVTAHLYLPHAITAPRPAILFLCGHSFDGKLSARYQTICQLLVRRGFVVLIMDPPGQGERCSYYDPETKEILIRPGTGEHEYSGLQCTVLGRNITRYFLHDAIRAVDLLEHHPLVDGKRIGITGSSGGATQTTLMMLVEPRLTAAAPTSFVSSRMAIFDSGYAQDAEQIWQEFTKEGYDHADLLAAFAPKPLNIQLACYDYFPIEGTLHSVEQARPLWKLYGKPDHLTISQGRNTHGYSNPLGQAAVRFFEKHFGPVEGEEALPESIIPFPSEQLHCTRNGQVRGDYPEILTVFDENRLDYLALRACRSRTALAEGRKFLKNQVFSHREPTPLHLRITGTRRHAHLQVQNGFWWSQRGILNSGMLIQSMETRHQHTPVTIACWKGGTANLQPHTEWIFSTIAQGRAVFIVNPSGVGPLEPAPFNSNSPEQFFYGTQFRIADDLHTLGDSYAALRTYDLLRSIETLPEWGGIDCSDIAFYGYGPYGIYAALAASLAESPLHWDNPLPKYEEILLSKYYNDYETKLFIIPGLLNYCDWDELVQPFWRNEVVPASTQDAVPDWESSPATGATYTGPAGVGDPVANTSV